MASHIILWITPRGRCDFLGMLFDPDRLGPSAEARDLDFVGLDPWSCSSPILGRRLQVLMMRHDSGHAAIW